MESLDPKSQLFQSAVSSSNPSSKDLNTSYKSSSLKPIFSKNILVILVVASATFVLLGTYLLLTLQQDNPSQSATNQLKTTTDPTATWQTYRNDGFGFEVRYPERWHVAKGNIKAKSPG